MCIRKLWENVSGEYHYIPRPVLDEAPQRSRKSSRTVQRLSFFQSPCAVENLYPTTGLNPIAA